MGRTKDTKTQSEFTQLPPSDTHRMARAKCNHCLKEMAWSNTRMREHLGQCPSLVHTTAYQRDSIGSMSTVFSVLLFDCTTGKRIRTLLETPGPGTTSKSSAVPTWADSMDSNTQTEIHRLIAHAIHVNGQPFTLLSSPEWVAVFDKLRPSFHLPPAEKIGGELLTDNYKHHLSLVAAEFKNCKAVGKFSFNYYTFPVLCYFCSYYLKNKVISKL